MENKLEELEGYLKQLIAVEVLEYEDKNWLSEDPGHRGKSKEEMLRICRLIVGELKEEKDILAASLRKEDIVHVHPHGKTGMCSCGWKDGHG